MTQPTGAERSTALRRIQAPPPSADVSVFDAFTDEQLDLIRRTVANGATKDELALFLYQCQRTGLDPLSRQIHFVKRQGKGTIQTAIDGYRLIADRTGAYAGSDDYRFDEGLTEYEHVQSKRGNPTTATVTVYKIVGPPGHGQRVPFTASARWEEYYPGDKQGFMWRKMPYLMLGKCTEALALRKAFPAELSGVYTDEEMAQAGASVVEPPAASKRIGFPGEEVYAGPEPAEETAVEVVEAELVEPDFEAVERTAADRFDRISDASEETLNDWYREANEGGKAGTWPPQLAARLMRAIREEAAQRKAA